MPFEILQSAFVLLCRGAGGKRAEIAPLAGLRIDLAGKDGICRKKACGSSALASHFSFTYRLRLADVAPLRAPHRRRRLLALWNVAPRLSPKTVPRDVDCSRAKLV